MGKVAFLFPGQGAQYIGMGKDFYDEYDVARGIFKRADDILNFPISELIFNGGEDLSRTAITQPAILLTSVAIHEVLREEGLVPDAVAGLSLGEYSALVAAGAFSLEDALPLVQKRGIYMQEAVPPGQGMMVAVIGAGRADVENMCKRASSLGIVQPANFNYPGQIVISGESKAVKRAMEIAGEEKLARRMVILKVSAPFHSKLMLPVQKKLSAELDRIKIEKPAVPLVSNVSGSFVTDPQLIKEALVKQVSNTVRWEDSIVNLIDGGFDTFVEVGPGKVLTGFMNKISPDVNSSSIDDVESWLQAKERIMERGNMKYA
ncbi:MAG: ACP S-malonyltransferase [Firmicutes bacterium]|nr:ACP S-malonyltransferase [Bacillota bacterium]